MATDNTSLNLGATIASFRHAKGMTNKELSELAGVTPSMLSQIENGGANPSIATLKAIADALDEPLPYFFSNDQSAVQDKLTCRKSERSSYFLPDEKNPLEPMPLSHGTTLELISPSTSTFCNMLMLIIQPHSASNQRPRGHKEEEIDYIESGKVIITLGNYSTTLSAGDTVSIPPMTPHIFRNDFDEPVSIIQVIERIK